LAARRTSRLAERPAGSIRNKNANPFTPNEKAIRRISARLPLLDAPPADAQPGLNPRAHLRPDLPAQLFDESPALLARRIGMPTQERLGMSRAIRRDRAHRQRNGNRSQAFRFRARKEFASIVVGAKEAMNLAQKHRAIAAAPGHQPERNSSPGSARAAAKMSAPFGGRVVHRRLNPTAA